MSSFLSQIDSTDDLTINRPEVILLDIEGTMTDSKYVSALFLFIETNIKKWLTETFDRKETKEMIERLRKSQIAFPECKFFLILVFKFIAIIF